MFANSKSNGGESENNNVVEIAGDGMELNGEAKIHGTVHIFVDGEPLCGNPHVAENYESGRYFAREEEFPLGTHGLCEHCGRSFVNDGGSNDEQFAIAGELQEGDYVALETESGDELVGRVRHDDSDGFPRRFLTLVLSDEPRERWAYGVEKSVKVKVRAGDGIVTEDGMMTGGGIEFEVASFEPTEPENDIDAQTDDVLDELSELVSGMELGEYGGAKTAGKEVEKFAVGIKGEERLNELKNLVNDARRFEVRDVTPASEREHSSYSTVVVETRRFDEFEVARTDNNEPLSAGDEVTVSGGSFDGSMTYRVSKINGSRVTLDDGRSMPGTHLELVSDPEPETDGGEPEVMTDGGSQLDKYDWSDIEIPEEGQVAKVTYLSDRSGNEKTVSGPIEHVSRLASRVAGEMQPGISLRVRDGERDIKVNTPRGTVSSVKSQYTRLGSLVDVEYREPVTDGGSDEERHEREEQRGFDKMFARAATPDDARYIMVCHHCGTCIWRKQDSAVVKRARRNEQSCSCGGEYVLVEDARSEEYDDAGELIEDGGERLMTDGGEEPTGSGEGSEEPPRWRDWSNVREERNNDRLMTDGGSRVHPDDEGVEILDGSGNDDDSGIIVAGDDGEIITDGGVAEFDEVTDADRDVVTDPSERDECGICGGELRRIGKAQYFKYRGRLVIIECWKCQRCNTGGNLLRRRVDGEVLRRSHVHTGNGFQHYDPEGV